MDEAISARMDKQESVAVTLLLLTYNQEQYVETALSSLLAQDCDSLDILVSDDCSTDRTFQLIQERVRSYNGPHTVRLNRNPKNLGIGQHIRHVTTMLRGDIIVLAAGDDISAPERVREHLNVYEVDSGVFACFSAFRAVSDDGERVLERVDVNPVECSVPALVQNGGGTGRGATYSYRRECFHWPWKYPGAIMNEDRLLPLRGALLGEVAQITRPLVDYRHSVTGFSRVTPLHRLLARFSTLHLQELDRTLRHAVETGAYSADGKSIQESQATLRRLMRASRLLAFNSDSNSWVMKAYRAGILFLYSPGKRWKAVRSLLLVR